MRKKILTTCFVLGLFLLINITNNPNPKVNAIVTSDSIEVFSDADFITLGCPGLGTAEDPYRIENYSISLSDVNNEGIYVKNTTKYFTVQGCEITSSFYGVLVEYVTPGTCQIIGNHFFANKHDGICLKESSGIIVSNNVLETSVYATGLSIVNCEDIIFTNNIVQNNPKSGLAIYGSTSINISRNTFKGNTAMGMTAACTSDLRVYENQFEQNGFYGLEFTTGCIDNVVYHNNFIDNYPGGICQARDSDGNSLWYNTVILEGSYWSDYSGTGDYSILGSDCCDLYPLSEPLNFDEQDPTETSFTHLLITLLSLPIIYGLRRKRE